MADDRAAEPTGARAEGTDDELGEGALDAVSGGYGLPPSMLMDIARSVIICEAPTQPPTGDPPSQQG